MKRIFSLIICLVFAFLALSACSDNNAEKEKTTISPVSTTANSYIGDGFKQTLSLLVESNSFLVNEVFTRRTLTVDESQPKKDGASTYYPVISDRVTSYASLVNHVNATYIKETASKLLENGTYKEIDGKLYSRIKHTAKHEAAELTETVIEGVSVTEEKCVFKTISANGEETEMCAVNDNGTWKLEKIYTEI